MGIEYLLGTSHLISLKFIMDNYDILHYHMMQVYATPL